MLKNVEKIAAGMDLYDVYKILGVPFKVLSNQEDIPEMALFQEKKFFRKLVIVKVIFKEGLVYEVKQSVEKRLSIKNV